MELSFWIAQILGIIGIIINVISMQLNDKKKILICYIAANWIFAINFYLLNAYTGAIICFISGFETFINNLYNNKSKKIPKWLIFIYFVVSVTLGIYTYSAFVDFIPIIGSILFIGAISVNKESTIRKVTLINMIMWTIYDIFVKSYFAAISDFLMMISSIIGIFRFDIKKEKY